MNAQLIDTDTLKTITGHKTLSSLEKCLRDQKIPFLYGKGGAIFTTVDALNSALGLSKPAQDDQQPIEFIR